MQLSAKDVFYSQGSLFINLVYSFLKGWGGLFLFCFVKVLVFLYLFSSDANLERARVNVKLRSRAIELKISGTRPTHVSTYDKEWKDK